MSRYDGIQESFEARALPLFEKHQNELNQKFRLDGETPQEEREKKYQAEVWPRYEAAWAKAAGDYVRETVELKTELEGKIFGRPDPSRLIGLASTPTEKLSEVLSMAKESGDVSLQRSVIAVARQRGARELVNQWVESDPGRQAANQELNSIPELERLEGIAKGRKVPRAQPESLQPDQDAINKQISAEASERASRQAFYEARLTRSRTISGTPTSRLGEHGE